MFLRKLHNNIFDFVGIWDLAKNKALFFAGRLNAHVAEIENRRNNAFDGCGYILDARKIELAYLADEEAFLFNVDDTFVGDDPDVKIVVNPREKTEKPNEDEECVFSKGEEASILIADYLWEHGRQEKSARDEKERKKNDNDEMREDIEPVAMDDRENLLVFSLALKMKAVEFV